MSGEELIFIGAGHMVLSVALAVCLVVGISFLISQRKSQTYRKFLADMYVAAKIRVLAKEDNLSIDDENENYKAWCKKQRASNREYDLDNVVEEELKERVEAPSKPAKKDK